MKIHTTARKLRHVLCFVFTITLIAAAVPAQAGDYALNYDKDNSCHHLTLEAGGTGAVDSTAINWTVMGNDVIVWVPGTGIIFRMVDAAKNPQPATGDVKDSSGAVIGDWEAGEGCP